MTIDETVKILRNHKKIMPNSTTSAALEKAIKTLVDLKKPKVVLHCENCEHFMRLKSDEVYGICTKTHLLFETDGEINSKTFSCCLLKKGSLAAAEKT